MKVIILAGGLGTRLRPLTLDRPAALLPVANRPLIEYLLEHLFRHRVSEATICLHHHPYLLESHLGDGAPWGVRVRYALERRPLGTAGAVRAAVGSWTGEVVVAFATALTTVDLGKALTSHQIRRADLTLVLAPGAGGAEGIGLDDEGCVTLGGTTSSAAYSFTGLAVLDQRALSLIPVGTRGDLIEDLVPRLLARGFVVQGYVAAEPTVLVRTPADLASANRRALIGDLPALVLPGFETSRGVRISRQARVHRTARLVPPVLVGANAVIGRDTMLEATIVGDDAMVGPESSIRNSVLFAHTYVGRGLALCGALVDRDRIHRDDAGIWATVRDARLLRDTSAPRRQRSKGISGRLLAGVLILLTSPVWLLLAAILTVETGGRPLRARSVVAGRGDARLWRVAVRGPCGRLLRRLGLVRAPYVWSIARGDLGWFGTRPRSRSLPGALAARAEPPAAPPTLIRPRTCDGSCADTSEARRCP